MYLIVMEDGTLNQVIELTEEDRIALDAGIYDIVCYDTVNNVFKSMDYHNWNTWDTIEIYDRAPEERGNHD